MAAPGTPEGSNERMGKLREMDVSRELTTILDNQVAVMKNDLLDFMGTQRNTILARAQSVLDDERAAADARLAEEVALREEALGVIKALEKKNKHTETKLDNLSVLCLKLHDEMADRMQMQNLWNRWKTQVARNRRLKNMFKHAVDRYQNKGIVKKVLREWRVVALQMKLEKISVSTEHAMKVVTDKFELQLAEIEAVFKADLEESRKALAAERELRVKLEEDMRQAFMRGVCALNLEAISVFKQGVPHPLYNPTVGADISNQLPAGLSLPTEEQMEGPLGPAPGMEEVAKRVQAALAQQLAQKLQVSQAARG